jgi:hypothetical protein
VAAAMTFTWKRAGHWLLVAAAVTLATVLLLTSGIVVWSPLNCWYEDVDIHSGRIRRTWMLLYCQVSQCEEETWLSRAAGPQSQSREWRRVNTFSPGTHHSPHYAYHGAIHQIRMLESIDKLVPLEPAARHRAANQLLLEWQNKGSYFGADAYLEKLFAVTCSLEERGAPAMTEADLP